MSNDIETIVYSDIPVDDVFNDGDEDIALDASGDYRRKSKTARDKQVYDKAKTSIVAGDNITVTADDAAQTLTVASTASGGGSGDTVAAGDGITITGTDTKTIAVTNPFTDADESKLDGIEAGAQVNPARAGAFTAADEAKLDGIEAGAQVNPAPLPHSLSFSAQDNDTSDTINNGSIGFFNGSTQIQSGSLGVMTHLYIRLQMLQRMGKTLHHLART